MQNGTLEHSRAQQLLYNVITNEILRLSSRNPSLVRCFAPTYDMPNKTRAMGYKTVCYQECHPVQHARCLPIIPRQKLQVSARVS